MTTLTRQLPDAPLSKFSQYSEYEYGILSIVDLNIEIGKWPSFADFEANNKMILQKIVRYSSKSCIDLLIHDCAWNFRTFRADRNANIFHLCAVREHDANRLIVALSLLWPEGLYTLDEQSLAPIHYAIAAQPHIRPKKWRERQCSGSSYVKTTLATAFAEAKMDFQHKNLICPLVFALALASKTNMIDDVATDYCEMLRELIHYGAQPETAKKRYALRAVYYIENTAHKIEKEHQDAFYAKFIGYLDTSNPKNRGKARPTIEPFFEVKHFVLKHHTALHFLIEHLSLNKYYQLIEQTEKFYLKHKDDITEEKKVRASLETHLKTLYQFADKQPIRTYEYILKNVLEIRTVLHELFAPLPLEFTLFVAYCLRLYVLHPNFIDFHQHGKPSPKQFMERSILLSHQFMMRYGFYCRNIYQSKEPQSMFDLQQRLKAYTFDDRVDCPTNSAPIKEAFYAFADTHARIKQAIFKLVCNPINPLNIADNEGNIPLHLAGIAGDVELFDLLLLHGANVVARNKKNETPLEAFLQSGAPPERIAQLNKILLERLSLMLEKLKLINWGDDIPDVVKEQFTLLRDMRLDNAMFTYMKFYEMGLSGHEKSLSRWRSKPSPVAQAYLDLFMNFSRSREEAFQLFLNAHQAESKAIPPAIPPRPAAHKWPALLTTTGPSAPPLDPPPYDAPGLQPPAYDPATAPAAFKKVL